MRDKDPRVIKKVFLISISILVIALLVSMGCFVLGYYNSKNDQLIYAEKEGDIILTIDTNNNSIVSKNSSIDAKFNLTNPYDKDISVKGIFYNITLRNLNYTKVWNSNLILANGNSFTKFHNYKPGNTTVFQETIDLNRLLSITGSYKLNKRTIGNYSIEFSYGDFHAEPKYFKVVE